MIMRGANQHGPSINNGANGSGMGPKPDKGQPFSNYRLQWSGKDR